MQNSRRYKGPRKLYNRASLAPFFLKISGSATVNKIVPEEDHHRPKRWIEIHNKILPNKVDVCCGCGFIKLLKK